MTGEDDAISRKAVIDLFEQIKEEYPRLYTAVEFSIRMLPPVKPQEPKTGRWIEVIDKIDSLGNKTWWHHKCSICGNEDSGWGNYKYCPNCGAEMESES